jgi:hypothetical protein
LVSAFQPKEGARNNFSLVRTKTLLHLDGKISDVALYPNRERGVEKGCSIAGVVRVATRRIDERGLNGFGLWSDGILGLDESGE